MRYVADPRAGPSRIVNDANDDLSIRTVASWAAGVVVVLASVVLTGVIVGAVADPQAVCRETLPFAEGLVIESAERAWPPPLVRCGWVDTDPGQANVRGQAAAMSAGIVATTIVVDVIAVGWIAVWRRRRRQSSDDRGRDSDRATKRIRADRA